MFCVWYRQEMHTSFVHTRLHRKLRTFSGCAKIGQIFKYPHFCATSRLFSFSSSAITCITNQISHLHISIYRIIFSYIAFTSPIPCISLILRYILYNIILHSTQYYTNNVVFNVNQGYKYLKKISNLQHNHQSLRLQARRYLNYASCIVCPANPISTIGNFPNVCLTA